MAELVSRLIAATVFLDRARLVRQATVQLEPGEQHVTFADLPLRLDPDSVRASARGTAQARLLSVQVARSFFADSPATRVQELESEIEALQDKIQGYKDQTALLEKTRAAMQALGEQSNTFATALAAGEMSIEAQFTLYDQLRGRLERLSDEGRTIAAQQRQVERELGKLKNQLDQLRSARPKERYTATVGLDVQQAGELAVELFYEMRGASWRPLYDLRVVEEADSALEVGYLAQVQQDSGEEWENVQLALSTARPALAATLPELDPWYLLPMPTPAAKRAVRAMPAEIAPMVAAAADLPAESDMVGAALEPMEAQEVFAGVESARAAVTYRLSAPATIPADGAPHKVSVTRFRLPLIMDYVSAPKLVEAAYRRVKVTNDSPHMLLPGEANLFAEDDFIGRTGLELTPPQGEIELYLGVDDRVRVERELVRREVDKRLIGGKRRVRYGYKITLENLTPGEATLELHDQMPVARHEDIKVRLESAEPPPSEQSKLNLLKWIFKLAPKSKQTVHFEFSVEYPPEMNVAGLI